MSVLFELFISFFKIGLFTFGGGYAMIPMISADMIAKNWLTEVELVDLIGISESMPGPFAGSIATFVGNRVGSQLGSPFLGVLGALCAVLGVVLPSFIVILMISKFFFSFRENKIVAGGLSGIRPAVIGLISAAAFSIINTGIFGGALLRIFSEAFAPGRDAIFSFGIAVTIFALSRLKIKSKSLHPTVLIGIAALIGVIVFGVIL